MIVRVTRRPSLVSALAAAFAAALAGAVRADSPRLLFHAPFDGSAVAAVAAGNPTPLEEAGLDWGEGPVPGTKALRLRHESPPARISLAYAAAGNLPRESGTVALWTRREWDFAAEKQPWRCLFATPMPDGDRDKKRIGSGTLWFWWNGTRLRADQSDAKDRYAAFDGLPPSTNWLHLAFSWRPERVELFVNGKRRRALRDGDSPIRDAIAEAECAAHPLDRSWFDRFFVGNLAGTDVADSLISDFRIYGSALTEEQVWTVFQNGMISHRGTEAQSGDDLSSSPNCDDILRGSVPLCEPFRHEREPLPGEAPGTIAPEALELVAEWVARPEAAPPRQAGGTPLFRHLVLSRPPSEVSGSPRRGAEGGAYWEAGTNKGDRFAIPLSLPAGVPLFLVEIDVPDDRLRTEDLILQPASGETDYAMQVGLLLGGEYPNSGTMLTHRCLYWARTNDVALVAMTARDGAPAAVAAVRVYTVRDAALPSCREGARKAPLVRESRSAALYYEDPAINFGFGFSTRDASKPEVFAEELSRLAATMKYTGLDTLFYPGAWYQGLIGENGYNPRNHAPHWRRILYAAFDGEGLRFIPTVNLNNIPWKPGAVSAAALTNGMLHSSPIAIHDTGKPNPGRWHNTPPNYNVLHPDVQREVERIFDVLVAEGAEHPSFGGICLHLTQHCCLWWGSEKSGYNDYAIEAFCRDRGIALPVLPQPPSGGAGSPRRGAEGAPLRGAAYAEWLRADPALWNAWLQWRCDQITAFYARLAARLAAARPDAKLYLNNFVPPDIKHPDFASDPDFARNAARRCGLDISALERAIPNLVVMQTSVPADFRWGYVDRYFRFDNPDKREDAIARIRDLDATPGFWAPLGEASHPWANIHDRYWESPIGAKGDSLSRDGFVECKWRVSTLNPGGANALRHWLAPLRHHDVLGLSKGGFLVGTYGMEARLAPFLTAFRSLPPVTLRELPQSTALVKVRGGEWHGTNYLYAVNTGDAPVDIELPFPASDVRLAPGEIRLFTSPTWRLPPEARIEGDTLVVEIPQDATPEARKAHCILPLDLSRELADGHGALVSVRVSAEGVSKPDLPWNGVKCMLHFIDAESGAARWPGAGLPQVKAFTNLLAQTRIGPLDLNGLPADHRAELILGLEGCTGRAEFDLSTLRVKSEDLGLAPTNRDWVVRYPSCREGEREARPARSLRGFMLPGRPTTERDIADIAAMGATLARFQITRNWSKVDDNQDLDEFRRWIDRRVDNLVNVLDWASQYGLKICIDLHQPPGGKRGRGGRPYEMNMFHDARYADEFVATWRHIASRVKGHPAIYGFDLVNEPAQHGAAKFSYWELQRRAAEAVREIDPDTPIIVESNLADRARTFRYLSPLAMDNVIYQAHMYEPTLFTHQGVYGNATADGGKPLSWPGEFHGEKWDKEFIRRELQPVIDFQRRHKCRIYIGEFSAAAWAPGAENYLRDCIDLFEEYGWDWTYHAFREAPVWDVEKEGETMESMRPAADTPRKRILLEGLNRGADKPDRR